MRGVTSWLPPSLWEMVPWLAGVSGLLFVVSLVAIPFVLTRMPADYFVRSPAVHSSHAVLRLCVRVLKSLLGALFVIAGIAMLVLPGQGLLSILLGLTLLEFPGKRRLEIAIVRRPGVYRVINWIRGRAARPPLLLPPKSHEKSASD